MKQNFKKALLSSLPVGYLGILGAAIPLCGIQTTAAYADGANSTATIDNAQIQQELATLREQIAQLSAKTSAQQSDISKNLGNYPLDAGTVI
ncbi:MAG: hypothetical protein KGQ26_01850 [Rhodospirillales bacterium]|nr:hypothetical protein [Rhodospirillales bacterium]